MIMIRFIDIFLTAKSLTFSFLYSLFLFALLFLKTNFVIAQPETANLVGSTPTEFDVTFGGAASYRVPLNLPAGAAGLKPVISMSYSSQLGNGVMGLGWKLDSSIARIESCYKRSSSQVVNCLNGDELLPIGNGYYRTEIDTGVLVEEVSSDVFRLHYENGDIKTLNRYLSSPSLYLEKEHTQRGGANYTVNWLVDTENREPLMESIEYQGNRIVFSYEAREDKVESYWLGSVKNQTQRLQSVSITVGGQPLRDYNIYYAYDNVSSVSKITNIQECGSTGKCLEPLSFEWSDSGNKGLAVNSNGSSKEKYYGGMSSLVINLNNDGISDSFIKHDSLRLSTGQESGNLSTSSYKDKAFSYKGGVVFGDINGDGLDDIVSHLWKHGKDNITFYYQLNNGKGGFTSKKTIKKYRAKDYPRWSMYLQDINGDKHDDFVLHYGNKLRIYHGGANGIKASSYMDESISIKNVKEFSFQFSDVNGDKLVDLIAHKNGSKYTGGAVNVYVYLNQGQGIFANSPIKTKLIGGSNKYANRFKFGDINNDGLTDILLMYYASKSSRTALFVADGLGGFVKKPFSWPSGLPNNYGAPVRFLDMNGDGLNDLWIYEKKKLNKTKAEYFIAYNKGGSTFSSGKKVTGFVKTASTDNPSSESVGDFNGDGIQDILQSSRDNNTRILLGVSKKSYIHTFTDSYNNKTEVSYSTLHDQSVYTRDKYSSDIDRGDQQFFQNPLTVVKSINTPNSDVFYKYAGARMHSGEYGYLGFGSITSVLAKEDENGKPKSLVTVSYLNQKFPLVGKLKSVKKKVYNGYASEVIDNIQYKYTNENYLVATFDDVPVGSKSADSLIGDVQARGKFVTGADFSGQMNSYFNWFSLSLTGGVQKVYLKDEIIDYLQLSDDALIKTVRTKFKWSKAPSGHYARLVESLEMTRDVNGKSAKERVTDFQYEYQDSYGKSNSFLINTQTSYTCLCEGLDELPPEDRAYLGALIEKSEYDYNNDGLIQYEWLNKNDAKGVETYYEYDVYGNTSLTTVSAANGSIDHSQDARTSQWNYSNQGKYLSSETNSVGHIVTYQNYSVHGLPGLITDAKGLDTYHEYDGLGRTQLTTDHLGHNHFTTRGFCVDNPQGCSSTAHTWERNNLTASADSITYWDKQGYKVKHAAQSLQPSKWVVQAWDYDSYGRQTKESVPVLLPISSNISWSTNGDYNYTKNHYDELNRVIKQQLPGKNRSILKDYTNELGIETTDPDGRLTTENINVLGQLISRKQSDNTVIHYLYNEQGDVTQQKYPSVDSNGSPISGKYHKITNQYDIFGNQITTIDPNQGKWIYTYNAFGELVRQSDARNQHIHLSYDKLGRLISQRDSEAYTVWTYDQMYDGLLDSVSQYDISNLSASVQANLTPDNISASGAPLDYQQNTFYDDKTKQPESIQTLYRDNNKQLVSLTRTLSYDDYGRLRYETLPTAYKNQGNLSAPRLAYEYSSTGFLTHIHDRDSANVYREIKSLDAYGNVTFETLGNNLELYRDFNTNTGWAEVMQASNSNGLVIEQSYSQYDALGHAGRRDDASYYNGGADVQSWSDSFIYNDALKQQLTSVSTHYSQDIKGNKLSFNWHRDYRYDALGNIRNYDLHYSILPTSPITHTDVIADKLQAFYLLSTNRRPMSGDKIPQTDLPSQLIVEQTGTVYKLNTSLFKAPRSFLGGGLTPVFTVPRDSSWENLARVLYGSTNEEIDPLKPLPYSGDNESLNYHYNNNDRPHQLTSITGDLTHNYQYDANGNVTADGTKTYSINPHNKLERVRKNNNSTYFAYDPNRQRYLRVDDAGNNTVETSYVGNYERVVTTGPNARVEHKYYVGGIALVTQTEGVNTETTQVLISDYQESLVAITDNQGEIQQRFRYTPYGKRLDVGKGVTGSQSYTTKGYTAHEHIESMDLIHMGGRIYDPTIRRMIQSDPIVQAPEQILSYNRYSYIWNDPINGTDPTGYERDDNGRTFNTGARNYAWISGESQADATVDYAADFNIYGKDGWALGNPENKLTIDSFQASLLDDRTTEYAQGLMSNFNSYGMRELYNSFNAAANWQSPTDQYNGHYALRLSLSFSPQRRGAITAMAASLLFPARAKTDLHSRVKPINGRMPINSQYAGKTVPLGHLPKEIRNKYPHSVPFTGSGFPDFSRYSIRNVRIELGKTRGVDFTRADKAAGFNRSNPRPKGYTWHHHQDTGYMQLVPTDLHNAIKHTGGIARNR
jgi:RHS repeat-associated protein